MTTGTISFRGDTSGVVANAILNRSPVPPGRLNPDVPPKLEEIITKALEKDRKLGYQHASDLRADLQRMKRVSDSDAQALEGSSLQIALRRRRAASNPEIGFWPDSPRVRHNEA